MGTKFRIEGLKEVDAALRELREGMDMSRATVKNVARRALIDAATPMRDAAKVYAPYDEGDLREAITFSTKADPPLRPPPKFTAHGFRSDPSSGVEIVLGPARHPSQPIGSIALWNELGTVNNPAHPFMRPAWDGQKMPTLRRLTDSFRRQIAKATERARRKAARLAAKARG